MGKRCGGQLGITNDGPDSSKKVSKCDQEGSGADVILGKTGNIHLPSGGNMLLFVDQGAAQGLFFLDHVGQTVSKVGLGYI